MASVVATREAALQLCLLQEDFGLIRTVRVHGMENVDKQRFDDHLEAYGEAEIRRMIHEPKISPTAALVIAVAVILASGFLAASVVQVGLSPASALLMALAVATMVRPTLDWIAYRRAIAQAERSAGGIFAYLERKPELHQAGGAMFLPPLKQRISFENVTLESRSGRTLLDGLTVEIPAGKKTSIMALDEEAKHALVCLIPRLIDPKVGRVRIDGADLRDATLESVRAQVATVLQTDLVFSDTVLANIALGDPSYDLPRVIQAAKVAHAHHFIAELPLGLRHPDRPARRVPQARPAVPDRPGPRLPPRPVDRHHRGTDHAARRGRQGVRRRHRRAPRPGADPDHAPAPPLDHPVERPGDPAAQRPPRSRRDPARGQRREQALPPPPVHRVQPVRNRRDRSGPLRCLSRVDF